MEKTYELRPLTSKDIFPMSAIIAKIGMDELKSCFSEDLMKAVAKLCTDKVAVLADDSENEEEIAEAKNTVMEILTSDIGTFGGLAIDVANIIFRNLPKCENDIYTLLSNLSGMKRAELEDMSPAMFVSMIIDVVRMDEFKDFFKAVSGLQK